MSKDIELNRRRVLGGLVTIGAAGAAVGAGTFAYFSDSEQSTGNTISAASLDLDIDGQDSATTTVNTNIGYTNGIVPGDGQTDTSSISNTGDIPGYVDVVISENTNQNGNASFDTDLASELELAIYLSSDQNLDTGTDTQVFDGTANNLPGGATEETNYELPAGDTHYLIIDWLLPNDGDETLGQGESVEFDITVELNQVQNENA